MGSGGLSIVSAMLESEEIKYLLDTDVARQEFCAYLLDECKFHFEDPEVIHPSFLALAY